VLLEVHVSAGGDAVRDRNCPESELLTRAFGKKARPPPAQSV